MNRDGLQQRKEECTEKERKRKRKREEKGSEQYNRFCIVSIWHILCAEAIELYCYVSGFSEIENRKSPKEVIIKLP